MERDDPGYRGQADYTQLMLRAYDPLVLGASLRFVWRCPASRLAELYRRHVRARHLDVGPGTGYFLERAGLPADAEVTLLDPNSNVLGHASRRLRHLEVTTVQADVTRPLPVAGPFDSAALHLVIHCLRGPATRKATSIANVASVLDPGGVLFGASVLGDAGPHTRVARAVLHAYNRRGSFDNLDDSEASLRDMLAASFGRVEIGTIGSIAVFAASDPRPGGRSLGR